MRLTVNSTKLLCRVLDKIGLEYNVISATEADIYGTIKAADLVHALDEVGCETLSMHEKNESLETYYMNLVGGGADA